MKIIKKRSFELSKNTLFFRDNKFILIDLIFQLKTVFEEFLRYFLDFEE
jgi:hypothetical protein